MKLFTFSLFAFVAAVTIETVVHDVGEVQTSLFQLKSQVDKFHSSLHDVPALLHLQKTVFELIDNIETTTDDICASKNFTASNVMQVLKPLLALQEPISATLTSVDHKKKDFDRAVLHFVSVSALLKADVITLRDLITCLVATLQKRIPEAYFQVISTVATQIHDRMDYTINIVYKDTPIIPHKRH